MDYKLIPNKENAIAAYRMTNSGEPTKTVEKFVSSAKAGRFTQVNTI